MTKKPTGGPAFPNRGDNSPGFPYYDGMTLRDWFAGQVLMGDCVQDSFCPNERRAKWCYEMADAMLAEREKSE